MNVPKIENIRLSEIDADLSNRLRQVHDEDAGKLALSMQEIDSAGQVTRRQINPIIVRPKAGGGYLVVAGAHRVEAARKLGWYDIAAVVSEMSDDDAVHTEVDENLYRKDLNGADLTFFVSKKLELYTYSGGKLSRGRDLRKRDKLALLYHLT